MTRKKQKAKTRKGRAKVGASAGKPVSRPMRSAKAAAKPAAKETGGEGGLWGTAVQFLREVRTELKKVTWPSRKQTMGSTGVVLVLVVVVGVFLWLVDTLLARVVAIAMN